MHTIDITRLKTGTRILVETRNCVWDLVVVDPARALVKVYGTDPSVKDNRPVCGRFLHSCEPAAEDLNEGVPHSLVKDYTFLIQFSNCVLQGGPVVSALVEGDGWSYEAITAS